jgi:hypothetical protein
MNNFNLLHSNYQLKDFLKAKISDKDNFDSEKIHFEIFRFSYGAKEKNPVDNLRFYSKYDFKKSFKIEKSHVNDEIIF